MENIHYDGKKEKQQVVVSILLLLICIFNYLEKPTLHALIITFALYVAYVGGLKRSAH